ncbi:MAG: UDP-N-acetylglucosamine 2-epimerase (non-hydrolyzing) [Candidatus Yanofskybacteria bacterium CG10_big_fil_rev_8_21_14_0_10_46_23]|uniref:UDP-N-acetylglucosamine 2-epimerase (Non-hydrolyzing) n=1 Tax=Candidatus Yanofskybacteria bacterium CG10_big_fil_rev_8_21_14_0_10_46_23 TaxID=1975098 RepID=A0A2H0R551_9BACT|nr:MAG: UDP-N-acetylglucosamine 2-epimerase (non-hydrolyzing) [Candidatus Yanofskybacteria bacterium CG10_big_fil_rev_8_21_14_0_10_46_23]
MLNNKKKDIKKSLTVMTILGTRPEIIRLAAIIKKLDKFCNHVLVHTGQNYDYELNRVFFEDLNLRQPDIQLEVKSDTLHGQLANIIKETGKVLVEKRPDAVLVLGDTNSALSLINAKRLKIPIFHMEAGDRSFDENVPEELNRRIVDSISDVVIAYTEYSRRNLLREGIHPSKIFVSGSPIREVYTGMMGKFKKSKILKELKLTPKKFFTASIHREENVDISGGLELMVNSYNALVEKYGYPVVVSTHPRTMKRLGSLNLLKRADKKIIWHKPFGLIDYIWLQLNSFCVVSDSGTIHEDSSILGFPAIAIRKSTEKAEAIDAGHCGISGLDVESVLRNVAIATEDHFNTKTDPMPEAYTSLHVSSKIVRIVVGMAKIVDKKVWGDKKHV